MDSPESAEITKGLEIWGSEARWLRSHFSRSSVRVVLSYTSRLVVGVVLSLLVRPPSATRTPDSREHAAISYSVTSNAVNILPVAKQALSFDSSSHLR
jgi:hypothetical protein